MVNVELHDEMASETVQKFVRSNPHIEVTEFIQRGNNGDVYFGKRKKMGDDVVLKFYWSHPNYDESEEAVILNNISHDNILKISELKFLAPNFAYFLTPKISGGDLQGIIDDGNLSTRQALEIVAGILMGLTELHSKHKLVHRDLKPGNILIDLEKNIPIIADLGAVKKIEDANGHVTASKSTFYYLPPESIMGNEYYFQSDIYQVGLIMFQLLGGHFPLESPLDWFNKSELKQYNEIQNSSEKMAKFDEIFKNKITKSKICDVQKLPYYIDNNFKRVIKTATHFHYEKRYSNPSLFLKDIHNLLRQMPDYIENEDSLHIKKLSGKEFKISKNLRGEIILEKRIFKKPWRKQAHSGSMESALNIARTK